MLALILAVLTAGSIQVTIGSNNAIYVGRTRVPLAKLHSTFVHIAQQHPNTVAHLMIDVKAYYGTVIQVEDAAKIAGLKVSFARPTPVKPHAR